MKDYVVSVYKDHTEWRLNGLLHREDGPAIERSDGSKFWYQHGKLHREDSPATEWADGTKEWCLNGSLHREDGPARILPDGSKGWFLNGKQVTEEEHRRMTSNVKELTVEEIETLLGYKIKIIA